MVGGGLASIDVVKVLQMENYERALQKLCGVAAEHARTGKRDPGGTQGNTASIRRAWA